MHTYATHKMGSDSDEIDSDVEFELYSQLHYNQNVHANNDAGITLSCDDDGKTTLISENDSNDITHTKSAKWGLTNKSTKLPLSDSIIINSSQRTKFFNTLHPPSSDKDQEKVVDSDIEDWEVLDDVDDGNCDSFLTNVKEKTMPLISNDTSLWYVGNKDIEAAVSFTSSKPQVRYFGNKHIRCKNCDELGHIAIECPLPKKLRPCFKCGQTGHSAVKCPKRFFNSSFRHANSECHRCGQYGHLQGECPDLWRQFHITTKPGKIVASTVSLSAEKNCFYCAKVGHFGHACNKAFSNGTHVSSPSIHVYDKWKKIQRKHFKKSLSQKISGCINHKPDSNHGSSSSKSINKRIGRKPSKHLSSLQVNSNTSVIKNKPTKGIQRKTIQVKTRKRMAIKKNNC